MLKNKWQTKIIKLCDVIPQADNPRTISEQALSGLKASIRRFGMVELIILNERTMHIVGGHQRYSILLQSGITEAPMIVVNMSLEEELAASLTMNNTEIEGNFDEPILELINQVEKEMPDLFHAVKLDELQEKISKDLDKLMIPLEQKEDEDTWDSECPCCGHKWKVGSGDIVVVKGEI